MPKHKHQPEPQTDFDWQGLEERLKEARCECGRDYTALVTHYQQLLAWLVDGDLRGSHGATRIARRVVAMAWILYPALWNDSPSLSDLAKNLGIHKVMLSEHAAGFSKSFAVRNHSQVTFARKSSL